MHVSTTWRYVAYGALDVDLALADDSTDPPFAGISAQRDCVDNAVEVALVGKPEGTLRVVITGTEIIDVEIIDDRESTGGSGTIHIA